jgi:hypothetical protein
MDDIRQRRSRVDHRTGASIQPPTEEEQIVEFAKLKVCHQADGGPCSMHVTIPPSDKRCRMSRRMHVSCPYLGKVEPLKSKVVEHEEERRKDKLVYEPPPKVSL